MRPSLLLTVFVVASGCPGGGGPCSSPEVLFPAARADGRVTDAGLSVDVTWQPTSAPAAFYASPRVSSVSNVVLTDAGVTGAQVSSAAPGSLQFDLRYREGPARTCSHVGMDDTYVLSVTLPRAADGGVGAGQVKTSVELGAL